MSGTLPGCTAAADEQATEIAAPRLAVVRAGNIRAGDNHAISSPGNVDGAPRDDHAIGRNEDLQVAIGENQ